MLTWSSPTESTGLDKILSDLERQVRGNPTVEMVVGISDEELKQHALEAITTVMSSRDFDPMDPETFVRVYCLGFVVGTKHGESLAKANPE